MAVKVRLMRIGAKGRPFYRVVAVDERRKRTGSYLELLGTYNPLTTPKEINLNQPRIDAWIKNGAQLSDGFLRIIGKAKQRVPAKPKKAKGNSSASSTPAVENTPSPVEASETPEKAAEVSTEPVVETPVEQATPSVEETSQVEKAVETEEPVSEAKADVPSETSDEESGEEKGE